MKSYNQGDVIFRQGDAGESMYEIVWGSVGIYLDYGTENERQLTVLEESSFFGEMGMIDHARRSATAVALEKGTQLREITEDELGELFRRDPSKVFAIMRQLSGRLRRLTHDYMEACKTASRIEALEESSEDVGDIDEIRSRAARCVLKAFGYQAYL